MVGSLGITVFLEHMLA